MLGRSVRGCLGMKTTEAKEGEITKWPKVSCEGDGYIHDLHGQLSVHSHTSWILNLEPADSIRMAWQELWYESKRQAPATVAHNLASAFQKPTSRPLHIPQHGSRALHTEAQPGIQAPPLFALHCAVLQTPSILWEAEFPHQAMRITMEPTSGWLWELCSSIPCP